MQPTPRARRGVRHGLVAAALVVSLPLLSGCASNFSSPVFKDYNPVTGVNVREDGVWGMNMLVVLPASGGQGTLVGALLNTTKSEDRLVGAAVTVGPDDDAEVASQMVRSSLALQPHQLIEMSNPQTVLVEGDVEAGRFVNLTLTFQRSEPIEVEVPVVEPEGPYADVPLQAEPSPTPRDGERTAESPDPSASPSPEDQG